MPSVFAKPSRFNLSHTNLLTCDMGKLVPFYFEEVLPGDEFRVKTDAIIRLAPMLAPIFGEVDFYTHYFFVPNRLVWDNWEDFITNGLESGSSNAVWPYVTGSTGDDWDVGSLADYIGVPVKDAAGANGASVVSPNGKYFSALPFRAYDLIWNEWYRNEFLQTPLTISKADGADSTSNISLQSRSWKRDYLTSALPFTQLGNPALLPIFANANIDVPVAGDGKMLGFADASPLSGAVGLYSAGGSGSSREVYSRYLSSIVDMGASLPSGIQNAPDKILGINTDPTKSGLKGSVNLYTQSTLNVNEVRLAFQLQRMMERKARSGNRYVEYLAASFGVRSPDARLQRPEFLGGGKSPVMISEVLQTSEGTQNSPQGNMSGHGFGAARTHAFNKAFTEHGMILGILSVMPKASYFQGRRRALYRTTYTDYYQPELSHIGEQSILASEVIVNHTDANGVADETTPWAFQPRYEEYTRHLNEVHGDYRTNLNYWHLARQFGSTNVPFNSDFVTCEPSKRIFAAGDQADRPCWIAVLINRTNCLYV